MPTKTSRVDIKASPGHTRNSVRSFIGPYADVEHYVKECVECASGKGRPPNEGPSPGNIEPRHPFEVVSMDFVTHMPESERGNTFLLLLQDAFSGFVMCKPMRLTTVQDVAEVYEECVFRRFGASFTVRHDQDPRFMSELSQASCPLPERPTVEIEVAEDDDFDAALLPEDSWEPDSERNEYEVEKVLDLRWSKRTRTSRRTREYLVKWKGYDDPEWLPLSQLSCDELVYEFNPGARAQARSQTMQAGDDHPRAYPASGK
ncbi:unnamed protein product [Phytophthora fragariaefolia]|uniref:Unnamed protein product n=1 Tax=Phytophthora fragariaefolia TaxID=1490495 RepID=A0A9W6WVU8_9STRA|nr:unnamed protein product [Phytophthora fragariaefolia]